ncbi:hypothetical protein [Deinococcus peraridilitoris]|nr:hypothetical protein [Deinococcus peraridilitoris]
MTELIHSIYGVQRQVWDEANRRNDLNTDTLLQVWERLEVLSDEVGECLHDYVIQRDNSVVEHLREVEQRAYQELQHFHESA